MKYFLSIVYLPWASTFLNEVICYGSFVQTYFIDCSDLKLIDIISVIKDSDFFVGNNSGPLNLASALGVKSFGLIANDAISELKYSKIQLEYTYLFKKCFN